MNVPFGSQVLDAAARVMTPFILLFAAYVVAHGHASPGGGFQGGVILAGAIILVRLVRGTGASAWGPDRRGALVLACSGVLVYAGVGVACLAFGGRYLDYGVLPVSADPAVRRAFGSFAIELGVALGVTGVMVLIFDALTAWGQEE